MISFESVSGSEWTKNQSYNFATSRALGFQKVGAMGDDSKEAPAGHLEEWTIDVPNIPVSASLFDGLDSSATEEERKQLVWDTHKDAIFQAMKLRHVNEKLKKDVELQKANKRLHLLDQISEVQRQFLQKAKVRSYYLKPKAKSSSAACLFTQNQLMNASWFASYFSLALYLTTCSRVYWI